MVLCSGLHYIQLPALLFLIKKKKKVSVANLYILKRLVRSLVKISSKRVFSPLNLIVPLFL